MDTNEIMLNRKDRIEWIDIVKGIAILLVILGHSLEEGNWMRMCVYSFHVPLFILLSGFFYKDERFFLVLRKNAKQILAPYATTLFLQYVLCALLKRMSWELAMKKCFYTILYNVGIPTQRVNSVGVLWFLTMLFGVRILFWGVTRCCKENEKAKTLFVLLIVMGGLFLVQEKQYQLWYLPWSFDLILVAIGFYYVGYLLKKKNWILELVKDRLCIFLCLLIWGLGLWHGISLEFVWRSYPEGLTCLIVAVAGSIVCCAISYNFDKIKFVRKGLAWFGRGSLVILCIHHLEKELVLYECKFSGIKLFLIRLVMISSGYLMFCLGKWIIARIKEKWRLGNERI